MEGENNNRNDRGNNGGRQRFQNRRPYYQNDRRGQQRSEGGEHRPYRDNRDNRRPQQRQAQPAKRGELTAEEIAAETKSIESEIMMEIAEIRALKAKFES